MEPDPGPPRPRRRSRRRSGRSRLGCAFLGCALLLLSPFALIFAFVLADRIAFELSGDCVPMPGTSDACRGTAGFDVWNHTGETVEIVATRPDAFTDRVLATVPPRAMWPNDTFALVGGKCEPDIHLVVRTLDGRVVAERTGVCRRETWQVDEPGAS